MVDILAGYTKTSHKPKQNLDICSKWLTLKGNWTKSFPRVAEGGGGIRINKSEKMAQMFTIERLYIRYCAEGQCLMREKNSCFPEK